MKKLIKIQLTKSLVMKIIDKWKISIGYNHMSQLELNQTPSEETTLRARGYKILRKLGEGSFAKVKNEFSSDVVKGKK